MNPDETLYFNRLLDLADDIAEELKRMKFQAQPPILADVGIVSDRVAGTSLTGIATARIDPSDDRPTAFLAEPTDDVDDQCEQIRRYLIQLGYQVVPSSLLPREPTAFKDTMRNHLARSSLYVQILGASPGHYLPGADLRLPALQHRLALESGKAIIQWRPPDLDVQSVAETTHRSLLEGPAVLAVDLQEFMSLVGRRMEELRAPVSSIPNPVRPTTAQQSDELIFLVSEDCDPDRKLAERLVEALSNKGFGILLPRRTGGAAEIRMSHENHLMLCDFLMLIYGSNPDWVVQQFVSYRRVKARRETRLKAVVVCDGPPALKEDLPLKLPGMGVFTCRDQSRWNEPGWADALFDFLGGLKPGQAEP